MGDFYAGEGWEDRLGGERAAAEPGQSGALATPGCLLSGELELRESGFELERQGRVRIRRLLSAQVKRDDGKQED